MKNLTDLLAKMKTNHQDVMDAHHPDQWSSDLPTSGVKIQTREEFYGFQYLASDVFGQIEN